MTRAPGAAFSIEQLRLGDLRADEVLVDIAAAGVCHTDASFRSGHIAIELPTVLGHEGAGVVAAVGSDITDLEPGDHVALTFGSCGTCRPCCAALPSYCERSVDLNLRGNRLDGTSAYIDGSDVRSHFFGQSCFATRAVVPRRNAVRLPQDVPLHLAAPLGCGIQTGAGAVLNSLNARPGSSLAVFGAGAVGLSAVMAAAARDVGPIVVVDLVPSRLDLAMRLGATNIIDAHDIDPVDAIRDLTGGGATYSLEAVGSPAVLRQAVDSLATMGVCGVTGAGGSYEPKFDWRRIRTRGLSLRGISEGDSEPQHFIPALLDMHAEGRFPFDELITRFRFSDIESAFDAAASGTAIKPVLDMVTPR